LDSYDITKEPLSQDIHKAKQMYRKLIADSAGTAFIIIGSPRANYITEEFVSDIFGCKPFKTPEKECRVPFFFVYRETDHKVPSCFGGMRNPSVRANASVPGLHYIGKKGRWLVYPWRANKKDSGVIITRYNPNTKGIQLAVFGYAGRATDALGAQLMLQEKLFWPPSVEAKGKEIGIYICQFDLIQKLQKESAEENLLVKNCEVIPLTERTVKRFIR
jgi:hypothetical protein